MPAPRRTISFAEILSLSSSRRFEMLALSGVFGPEAQKDVTRVVYVQAAVVLTFTLGCAGYFLLSRLGLL